MDTQFDQLDQYSANNPDDAGYDQIKNVHLDESFDAIIEGKELLEEARQYWDNLSNLRERRTRVRKYYFGDQWHDKMEDPDNPGQYITEYEYIIRQGKIPLVANYMGPLFKNIKGQYRNNDSKPAVRARKKEDQLGADMLTNSLQAAYDFLKLAELDSQVFLEFLLSAVTTWKTGYEWNKGRNMEEVYCESVKTNRLFFNTDTNDIRGYDIRFIGQIIDAPIESVLKAYARDEAEREIIRGWYSEANTKYRVHDIMEMGAIKEDDLDFYTTYQNNLCRVFEIWKEKNIKKVFVHDPESGEYVQMPGSDIEMILEELKAENAIRELQGRTLLDEPEVKYEDVWCYYMLTPLGQILEAGETPYEHESHPFTLGLYPLVDGEVRAFGEDVIDLQKQVNRQVILQDFLISTSAKNTLIVDERHKPEGWTWDDYRAQWSKAGGMIVYKAIPGVDMPTEISSNSRSVTSEQMLQFALQSMKEISGITEAIQGHKPTAGTPASLYAEQANNATLATKDYFDHFGAVRKDRDYKLVRLMQQFYTEERHVARSGDEYIEEAADYNPAVAGEVAVDIVIGKSSNAPVYREVREQYLKDFFDRGAIDLEMFLENSTIPWSPSFVRAVKQHKEMMMQQMGIVDPNQAMPPEQQQEALAMLPRV
jgi:hypothetical protein